MNRIFEKQQFLLAVDIINSVLIGQAEGLE